MSTGIPPTTSGLRSLLTPERLLSIFKLGIPWPKDVQLNGQVWAEKPDESTWRLECWDALVAISKLGLNSVPDMMSFLPDPSSDDFPEQALGIMLLLDQAPRLVCEGLDERWRNDYFDHLALKFARQLHMLPRDQGIETKDRWITRSGYTFEHWTALRIFIAAPFAHAENMECQDIQSSMARELRRETADHYNATDQYHAKDPHLRDSRDTLAFARIAGTGGADSDEVKDHVFWYCWIMDAHPPIIRVFGRYPYRNAAVGRESTEEEKKFLEKTQHFGELSDKEAANKIMKDVKEGQWTPLGG
ncbi:uncharacterized protein BDR25DRAFT_301799 [Lindgomyces ingoldianus]|uniref:Uncharacterized protein n=1 Tax=Lindgomyces ingoldianus TaxID=673940 RepID=A0ACB6R2R3_9PLEO|nr:uncharacterized protein BDR25DRAFT_301799 [Lindgomyces ingoldianus]KAF2473548.1 hypothetical protein BDR25DRAFT_301799 [Lindgomyces ingoldianus]